MKRRLIRIFAMVWADILVAYPFFEMQDYLTDVLGISITRAASTVSIWTGVSLLLQPYFLIAYHTLLGNSLILVISTSAHALGIGFVYASAPCKYEEQECRGETETALLYAGMLFMAVGVAGNNASLISFFREQPNRLHSVPGMCMVAIAGVAGTFVLPLLQRSTLLYAIPAFCTAVATISCLSSICCYRHEILTPQTSRLPDLRTMPAVETAILWSTFIACATVSSMGTTYFVEQAKQLGRNGRKWKVPTQVLVVVQTCSARLLAYVLDWVLEETHDRVSGTFIVLFYSCAGFNPRLADDCLSGIPVEDFRSSVSWLLYQFVLLGGMGALLEKFGTEIQVKKDRGSLSHCPELFTKILSGVGFVVSGFLALVVGKGSIEANKQGWFHSTFSPCLLFLYYWALVLLCFFCLCIVTVLHEERLRE